MFHHWYPLAKLSTAPYNPRSINEASVTDLRESLQTFGCLKALIAAPNGMLLAGHQRAAQMRTIGWKGAPTHVLEHAVGAKDQARFNQLHNACDLDFAAPDVRIKDNHLLFIENSNGWVQVDASRIEGHVTGYANEKREICDLLARYGGWGNAVATDNGRIVVGGLYALCCALMGIPCLVSIVPDHYEGQLRQFFGRPYGRFDYANVKRETWRQSFAQMHRKGSVKSRTYENIVIPLLEANPKLRVLDFGAGQMDYVQKLRGDGYSIWGFEPYFRKGHNLDIASVRDHVHSLCKELRINGLFDVVVADSVVNSVDTQESEDDVFLCLGALCKPGGTIIFSGRNKNDQRLVSDELRKRRTGNTTSIGFFDENGLTALPRRDGWQFQKFHTLAEVAHLSRLWFGSEADIFDQEGKLLNGTPRFETFDRPAWAARAINQVGHIEPQLYVEALRREFDLPYPDGTLGMSDEIAYSQWAGVMISDGVASERLV